MGRQPDMDAKFVGLMTRISPRTTPSLSFAAEMSFRGAAAVPESYRINEF
jgi:hypothetical protein